MTRREFVNLEIGDIVIFDDGESSEKFIVIELVNRNCKKLLSGNSRFMDKYILFTSVSIKVTNCWRLDDRR